MMSYCKIDYIHGALYRVSDYHCYHVHFYDLWSKSRMRNLTHTDIIGTFMKGQLKHPNYYKQENHQWMEGWWMTQTHQWHKVIKGHTKIKHHVRTLITTEHLAIRQQPIVDLCPCICALAYFKMCQIRDRPLQRVPLYGCACCLCVHNLLSFPPAINLNKSL